MTVDTEARKLAAQAISEVALGQSTVNDQTAAATAAAGVATTKSLVATEQAEIATEQAQLAIAQAAQAASQAQAAQAAAVLENVLDSPVTAGGTLPFCVVAIENGKGTGTGGTPGTYVGGVSGGPAGFRWNYTIGANGALQDYEIVDFGLSLSGSAPTLSLPGGTGAMTGVVIPTAFTGEIPNGYMFYSPSEDEAHLLAWGNDAGTLTPAPFGGTQISIPLAGSLPMIGTAAQRGALTADQLFNGLHFFVTDFNPPRWYCYNTAGNRNPNGVVVTAGTWFNYDTPAEAKNLGTGEWTNQLPVDNVESLADTISDVAGVIAVEIADFRAIATSSAANPTVSLSWTIKGTLPDAQVIAWNGQSVPLDGRARSFSPPAWSAITLARIVGNSLSDIRDDNGSTVMHWPTIYGAASGQTIVSDAAYSSDWVQMLRAGLAPIMLNIGGSLPAAGTPASITAINGTAPSASPADGVSFLSVGDSTVITGLSMTGWIGDRHVTVSVANGGSAVYSVVQDAGGAAVPLTGPVQFIPDHALLNGKGILINATGQNYFYASIPQTYQGHTGYFNAGAFVNDGLIRASARGWPVLEWPVLPQADWAKTGAGNPYDAMTAFNALRETFAPQCKMRDAAGRTMLQRLQSAALAGNANDSADVAAGLIPRSLRQINGDGSIDPIHLSVSPNAGQTISGQQVIAAFVQEAVARVVASAPTAVTQNTTFTLSATAAQASTGAVSQDTAVTTVSLGEVAKSLASNAAGQGASQVGMLGGGFVQDYLAAAPWEATINRYMNGRKVVFARASVSYGMGDAITVDGYHFAKYSMRGANGIGFTQGSDGFWTIDGSGVLSQPFSTLNFTSGDTVSAPDLRYAYGKPIVWAAADSARRGGLMVAADGTVFGKLALRGAGGLSVSQGADGFWQFDGSTLLSAPFSVLNLVNGSSIADADQRYAYGRKIVWAAADATQRGGVLVSDDGTVFGKFALRGAGGLAVSQGADGFWTLDGSTLLATPFNTVNFASGDSIDGTGQRYYNGLRVFWALNGASLRSPLIVTEDGTVTIPKLSAPNLSTASAALETSAYLFDVATVSGKKVITRTSKTTGIKANATPTSSNAYAPRLSFDGTKLVYVTDRSGGLLSYYQALDGSLAGATVEHPALPLAGLLLGTGDSIMATGWIDPVAANFGLTLVSPSSVPTNVGGQTAGGGIGSTKSLQIAYRYGAGGYGGLPDLTCSLAGNTMTSGANVLTAILNPLLSRTADVAGAVRTLRASILGVTGVLTATQQASADSTTMPQITNYSSDNYVYTFTPDVGQTLPGAVPAGTVIKINPETRQDVPLIFHVGRNDSNAYTGWQANVQLAWAAILAAYKPLGRKVIGIGITNSRTEPSGSSAYNAIVAFNTTIAAAYPDNYFDVRPFYNAGEATDIPNAAYTDDGLHPNTAGKLNGFTNPLIAEINRRGWFS